MSAAGTAVVCFVAAGLCGCTCSARGSHPPAAKRHEERGAGSRGRSGSVHARWSTPIGSDIRVSVSAVGLSDRSAYLAGSFTGTMHLGTQARTADRRDGFVAKLERGGAPGWVTVFGGDGDQAVSDLVVTRDGVAVAGTFDRELETGSRRLASKGGTDLFLAKLGTGGRIAWLRQLGGPGDESPAAIAADGQGNIVVAAGFTSLSESMEFEGPSQFGNANLRSTDLSTDAVFAIYAADGTPGFARAFGGPGYQVFSDVAVLAGGDLAFAGELHAGDSEISFGGDRLRPIDEVSVFAAAMSEAGTHRWSTVLPWRGQPRDPRLATGTSGLLVAATLENAHASSGRSSPAAALAAIKPVGGQLIWSKTLDVACSPQPVDPPVADPAGRVRLVATACSDLTVRAAAGQGASWLLAGSLDGSVVHGDRHGACEDPRSESFVGRVSAAGELEAVDCHPGAGATGIATGPSGIIIGGQASSLAPPKPGGGSDAYVMHLVP